jgi:hypothetical protein
MQQHERKAKDYDTLINTQECGREQLLLLPHE